MARYEVSIQTRLAFHTRPEFGLDDLPRPETVAIDFEGRRFVWHAIERDEDGREYWPTVTTVVEEGYDSTEVARVFQWLFSALAFRTKASIGSVAEVVSDRAEMEPAFLRLPRRGFANDIHFAPAEVIVEGDDRLRVCLGHLRDGLNSGSPFFRFLAFWNALDVACDDYEGGLDGWVASALSRRGSVRLRESSRNAVAHAVRHPGRPDVDPDDPHDRHRLEGDAATVGRLVEQRIAQRWGEDAVTERRRP